MKAKELKQDGNNYRKHSDKNKRKIKKSIDEAGFGRSVVIDADGVLVCGNGVQSVIDGNTPVRLVETDGSELVVVKRTDLHEGDDRRKLLALADNAASDGVEWDEDKLLEEWGNDVLSEWGIDVSAEDEKGGNQYSRKIEAPVYEPSGDDVRISDLCDRSRYELLCGKIYDSGVDDEVKEFLRFAAARHLRFDYARIADFYANADAEVQALMEESALVIIDFEQAVANGYVRLAEDIVRDYEDENGEL